LVALIAGIKTSTGIFISDLCLSFVNPKSTSWAFKSFFLLLISSSGCWSVTAGLSSYQQIRICELCYQYITTGSRKMEIQELKKFIGIGKNKTTSDLIRELKSSKKQINQKTNLEIEFITIKTSRKITHIKFNFCRTDQHPLDEINNKKNDLKAQLIDLGFTKERHKSLIKIPVEVLIPAINATKKAIKEERIHKTIESCFFVKFISKVVV
jgi:plasmid replication initiation protein